MCHENRVFIHFTIHKFAELLTSVSHDTKLYLSNTPVYASDILLVYLAILKPLSCLSVTHVQSRFVFKYLTFYCNNFQCTVTEHTSQ
jgi:hypothetical protein